MIGLTVVSVGISAPELVVSVLSTLACLPIFWTSGVITRLEGWILIGFYGLYLLEQVLVAVLPLPEGE